MKRLDKLFPGILVPMLFLFAGLASAQTVPQREGPPSQPERAITADPGFGKPTNLRGSLWMVDGRRNLVVVMTSNGIPFDFQVTRKTRIDVNGATATFAELTGQIHNHVLVNFMPEPIGDIARSIEVAGT